MKIVWSSPHADSLVSQLYNFVVRHLFPQYLEMRFSVGVRILGSILFIVLTVSSVVSDFLFIYRFLWNKTEESGNAGVGIETKLNARFSISLNFQPEMNQAFTCFVLVSASNQNVFLSPDILSICGFVRALLGSSGRLVTWCFVYTSRHCVCKLGQLQCKISSPYNM